MKIECILPAGWQSALLLGRIDFGEGPTPVLLRNGRVEDMSTIASTVSDLLNDRSNNEALPQGRHVCAVTDLEVHSVWELTGAAPAIKLLAPVDLHCLKAAGVTFATSTLERVIEERARGDASAAENIRERLSDRIGKDIGSVEPGSEAAARLKTALIGDGLWSQYLEVAIGPDAEIFTKAPVLSSVGWGDHIGVRSDSNWNNSEPEIVLVCDGKGQARGATLGNDLNLRDFEGRSALLLAKAKDNNASCAIGPFIRLFDDRFGMDDVRRAEVNLEIVGRDNFVLNGRNNMNLISRDPAVLVSQTCGEHHQYPDGFALFLGTMFAPVQDRNAAGQGFTHAVGDRVRISTEQLGVLENQVTTSSHAAPWTFGISALMRNLVDRGLIRTKPKGLKNV